MSAWGSARKASLLLSIVVGSALAAGCSGGAHRAVSSGSTPSARAVQAVQEFGDVYSRWQLHPARFSSIWLDDGLLFVFDPDGTGSAASMGTLVAYNEGTGTQVWSRASTQEPESADPLIVPTGSVESGGCPQSVTRLNLANGAIQWTAQIPSGNNCGQALLANASYVAVGDTILDASTGVTLQQVPTDSAGDVPGGTISGVIPFGNDVVVEGDTDLELEARHDGSLQVKWHRAKLGTYWLAGAYPYLLLQDTENSDTTEIFNPATGAVTGIIHNRDVFPTSAGLTAVSATGHFMALSPTGATILTGPKVSYYGTMGYAQDVSYDGGIIWQYHSPRTLKGAYAIATAPGSFKNLGRLVLTPSQVTDYDGGGQIDSPDELISDGHYAAILAAPWIYVYKL
jgi:hypothetical protein